MSNLSGSAVYHLMLAYALRSVPPDDLAFFRRLVGKHGLLGGVTASCFLLYRPFDEREPSVHQFLFRVVPLLLPRLSRSTQPQRLLLHGNTRGRVDWANTYKVRYAEDGNPTTFICIQNLRRFDQPENQLLKFLLHQIQLCLDRVPKDLGNWQAWGQQFDPYQDKPIRLNDYFSSLVHRVRRFSTHIYLRNVSMPDRIDDQHLLAGRTSRNKLYADVIQFYDLYHCIVDVPKWEPWIETLASTLPLPPDAAEVGRSLAASRPTANKEQWRN